MDLFYSRLFAGERRNAREDERCFLFVVGAIGSAIASAFGGWDAALTTLCIFMAVDYLTGLIVAAVFKQSKKTESGALSSAVGWKGLVKKGVMLLIVLVAYRLDLLVGSSYIKDLVVISFVVNETLSIIENAGLMGIPIPTVISKAIDLLQKKTEAQTANSFAYEDEREDDDEA